MTDIAPLLLLHRSLTSVLLLLLVQVLTATALRHKLSLYITRVLHLVLDAAMLTTTAAFDNGVALVLEKELWSGRRLHCFQSLFLHVYLLLRFPHWLRWT